MFNLLPQFSKWATFVLVHLILCFLTKNLNQTLWYHTTQHHIRLAAPGLTLRWHGCYGDIHMDTHLPGLVPLFDLNLEVIRCDQLWERTAQTPWNPGLISRSADTGGPWRVHLDCTHMQNHKTHMLLFHSRCWCCPTCFTTTGLSADQQFVLQGSVVAL